MSDVEAGGATVFLDAEVIVYPRKVCSCQGHVYSRDEEVTFWQTALSKETAFYSASFSRICLTSSINHCPGLKKYFLRIYAFLGWRSILV